MRFARASVRPAANRIVPGAWDVVNGSQLLGGNVVEQDVHGVENITWAQRLWTNWQWTAWIKPQIDFLDGLGCNAVRFFGTTYARCTNPTPTGQSLISDADYFARWDQLANYLRSSGMYLVPTLGGDSAFNNASYGYTPDLAWFTDEATKIVRHLSKHSDVIPYIDLYNEAAQVGTLTNANMVSVYQAVKAACPFFKFSWSYAVFSASDVTDSTMRSKVSGASDIHEIHEYYSAGNPAASVFDGLLTADGKRVVIGEFGTPMSAGATARVDKYTAHKAVHQNVSSGRRVAGSIAWNTYDQTSDGGDTTNQYGLADQSGTARTNVTSILSTF